MSRHHYKKCTKLIFSVYISRVDIPLTYLCNSFTMVRGDHPRVLANGLSDLQVNRHGITILYHLHQCRPCTSRASSC